MMNRNTLMKKLTVLTLALLTFSTFYACTSDSTEQFERHVQTVDWAKNANIYEVNIRQYTPEGTFNAFAEDIPRLQEMGVKILWLMPIHPIGEVERKGTLGSYYSIQDFKAVNPEFGTKEDLRNLVQKAHDHDMKVIIDWVANHTAWDNVWTETNPEWFSRNEDGNFHPPVEDWSDVIQLDVDHPEMQEAMIDALEYWVREFNIDGYRCDVAYMVPTDFWNRARARLDAIKPVFMLAEAEAPEHHVRAFDMSYAWEYAHIIREIGAGNEGLDRLDYIMEKDLARFAKSDYRMYFTSNHDENSWKGTDPGMFGDNFENFAVLSATVWGMPLIYNGQESNLDKQLEFFEKDEIEWKNYELQPFYTTLLALNTNNTALWNGEYGGDFIRVHTDNDEVIYSYKRVNDNDEVFVILNFSGSQEDFTFSDHQHGAFRNVFTDEVMAPEMRMTLPANSYFLLERI